MTQVVYVQSSDVRQLVNNLRNPKKLLDEVGQALVKSQQERIRSTKASPEGRPWAPWAPSTAAARAKRGTAGRGLLYDRGTLLNSITYQIKGKTVEVGPDSSKAPYAGYLQDGTPNMPARPFVGFSQKDQSVIGNAVQRYLMGR